MIIQMKNGLPLALLPLSPTILRLRFLLLELYFLLHSLHSLQSSSPPLFSSLFFILLQLLNHFTHLPNLLSVEEKDKRAGPKNQSDSS